MAGGIHGKDLLSADHITHREKRISISILRFVWGMLSVVAFADPTVAKKSGSTDQQGNRKDDGGKQVTLGSQGISSNGGSDQRGQTAQRANEKEHGELHR